MTAALQARVHPFSMNISARQSQLYNSEEYDRAFVRTVLRLDGVCGTPTDAQLAGAKHTFRQYGRKVSEARAFDLDSDSGWLQEHMPEQAAVAHAFIFVKYDSVLNSTQAQSAALHRWMQCGGH